MCWAGKEKRARTATRAEDMLLRQAASRNAVKLFIGISVDRGSQHAPYLQPLPHPDFLFLSGLVGSLPLIRRIRYLRAEGA